MAHGSDDVLNSFVLGGYKLEVAAPDEMRFGLLSAMRFFFYKNGPTIVQKGRVTPKPVTLSFKHSGPQAIAIAKYLERMQSKQTLLDLQWARQFYYKGHILNSDWSVTQQTITGTIEFQPTEIIPQTTQENALGAARFAVGTETLLDPAEQASQAKTAMQNVLDATAAMGDQVSAIRQTIQEDLAPVYAFQEGAQTAVSNVQTAIQAAGDLASLPYQTASSLVDSVMSVVNLAPAALGEITNKVFAPIAAAAQNTGSFLASAAGQEAAVAIDDTEANLRLLAYSIAPPLIEYTAGDEDTAEFIAAAFGTTVPALLEVNPSMRAGRVAAGTVVKIPPNA